MWLTLLTNWRTWAVLGYVLLAGWGALQTWRLGNTQDKLVLLQGQFDLFKEQVAAEGAAAQKAADAIVSKQKQTIKQTRSKYETDMVAVHKYWAGRLRGESCASSSSVPAADSDSSGADAAADQPSIAGGLKAPTTGSLEACAQDALTLATLQLFLLANGHVAQ